MGNGIKANRISSGNQASKVSQQLGCPIVRTVHFVGMKTACRPVQFVICVYAGALLSVWPVSHAGPCKGMNPPTVSVRFHPNLCKYGSVDCTFQNEDVPAILINLKHMALNNVQSKTSENFNVQGKTSACFA